MLFLSESECQKRSCEIATSQRRFIKKTAADSISDFYLFSDGCGGQNNNHMIFIMLSDIMYVNARSIIEQISRKETICTPAEWEAVI